MKSTKRSAQLLMLAIGAILMSCEAT
jgi:hypothetical protein